MRALQRGSFISLSICCPSPHEVHFGRSPFLSLFCSLLRYQPTTTTNRRRCCSVSHALVRRCRGRVCADKSAAVRYSLYASGVRIACCSDRTRGASSLAHRHLAVSTVENKHTHTHTHTALFCFRATSCSRLERKDKTKKILCR